MIPGECEHLDYEEWMDGSAECLSCGTRWEAEDREEEEE